MSICDEVRNRRTEGRLFLYSPVFPSDLCERTILLSCELHGLVQGGGATERDASRWSRVRADLDMFVMGQFISVGQKTCCYMSRLEKPEDEVWEVRCRDPRPGIRLFGSFAKTDTLVLLTYEQRALLGDKNSVNWKHQIQKCRSEWRKLFPTYSPFTGRFPHDYISENADVV